MATRPDPMLGRALQLQSAQAADRRTAAEASGVEDILGGDTALSDSSLTPGGGGEDARSPLDIGQLGRSYTSGQVPQVEAPVAGGGYQESDAERMAKLEREKQMGRRAQEQLLGAGATFGAPERRREPGGTGTAQVQEQDIGSMAPGTAPREATADRTSAEQDEAARAMALDQERQRMAPQERARAQARDLAAQLGSSDADWKKKMKLIKDVTMGVQAGISPGTLMATLVTLTLQMNLQLINKHTFKISWIPDQSFPEDVATVCLDCGMCFNVMTTPPCCFFILGLLLLMGMIITGKQLLGPFGALLGPSLGIPI